MLRRHLLGQARQGSTAQQDTSFKFAIGPGSGYRFRLAQEHVPVTLIRSMLDRYDCVVHK